MLVKQARKCVLSCCAKVRYPSSYPSNDRCTISVGSDNKRAINVVSFDTESSYDQLTVNGEAYDGSRGPGHVVPTQDITWHSDACMLLERSVCESKRNIVIVFQNKTQHDVWTSTHKQTCIYIYFYIYIYIYTYMYVFPGSSGYSMFRNHMWRAALVLLYLWMHIRYRTTTFNRDVQGGGLGHMLNTRVNFRTPVTAFDRLLSMTLPAG